MSSQQKNTDRFNSCFQWNTIHISDDAEANKWLHSETYKFIGTYFIPIIAIVCVTSNTSFIVMVMRLKRMHTITNWYLVNIAIADLILGLFPSVITLTSFYTSPFNNHMVLPEPYGCYVAYIVPYIGYLVSVGTITLVSYERYLAVCKPLLHRRMQSKSRTVRYTVIVWIVAFIMSTIGALGKGHSVIYCIEWPSGDRYLTLSNYFRLCEPIGSGYVQNALSIFSDIFEFVTFIIPMVINSFLFAFIIHALSNRPSISSTKTSEQSDNANQVRNQVARTLVINGIVFFLTQTPYRVRNLNSFVEFVSTTGFLNQSQAATLTIFGRGFVYMNSAINSFIYAFSSSFYRKGFRDAFSMKSTLKRDSG